MDRKVSRTIIKALLIWALAFLMLANLCVMLWGGEGALTQWQRALLMVAGLATLLTILRG